MTNEITGKLTGMASDELPAHVIAHLPAAEEAASKNLEAVRQKNERAIQSLHVQIQDASSAKFSGTKRVQRIRFLTSEMTKLFTPRTACASGCSHCCNIDVAVSSQEATIISKAIKRPLAVPSKTYELSETAGTLRHVGVPCTFLVEGRCSIYEHRPTMCRALVNMDDTALLCELQPGAMVPVPYLNMTQIHLAIGHATRNDRFADIRDWFPQGLRTGHAAVDPQTIERTNDS